MTYRVLIFALTLFPIITLALPDVPEERGWSGFLGAGMGYAKVKSNTVAGNRLIDGGKDTITDILQSPESTDTLHPIATGEANYTLANRNQLFFGTTLEDIVAFDSAFQFGWRKQTDKVGIFQLGLLLNAMVPAEVWADPYETGTPREEVDRDSYGVRFQWDKIFGTPLEWTVTYRDIDIESEHSGEAECTASCQAQLVRDGDYYETRLSWLFKLGGGHILRPLVGYRSMDAKGDAVSYDLPYVQLTYSYLGGKKFTFVSNASFGQQEYDQANPLYGIKQDSDNVLLDATLFYKLPVASQRWQLFGQISWGDIDSDINFHDNEVSVAALGLMYRFGNRPLIRKPMPAPDSQASLLPTSIFR
jgi:hypothetical protein